MPGSNYSKPRIRMNTNTIEGGSHRIHLRSQLHRQLVILHSAKGASEVATDPKFPIQPQHLSSIYRHCP